MFKNAKCCLDRSANNPSKKRVYCVSPFMQAHICKHKFNSGVSRYSPKVCYCSWKSWWYRNHNITAHLVYLIAELIRVSDVSCGKVSPFYTFSCQFRIFDLFILLTRYFNGNMYDQEREMTHSVHPCNRFAAFIHAFLCSESGLSETVVASAAILNWVKLVCS